MLTLRSKSRRSRTARLSAKRFRLRADTKSSPAVTVSSATFGSSLSRLIRTISYLQSALWAALFQRTSSRLLKRVCAIRSKRAFLPAIPQLASRLRSTTALITRLTAPKCRSRLRQVLLTKTVSPTLLQPCLSLSAASRLTFPTATWAT